MRAAEKTQTTIKTPEGEPDGDGGEEGRDLGRPSPRQESVIRRGDLAASARITVGIDRISFPQTIEGIDMSW